ncbi:MAG: hypothetical protein B7733_05735 [Myxococcales bacterium FL481]|nr:MAG: hypothetical protein B7733_05735 [Myxococcales bacterium FL481]
MQKLINRVPQELNDGEWPTCRFPDEFRGKYRAAVKNLGLDYNDISTPYERVIWHVATEREREILMKGRFTAPQEQVEPQQEGRKFDTGKPRAGLLPAATAALLDLPPRDMDADELVVGALEVLNGGHSEGMAQLGSSILHLRMGDADIGTSTALLEVADVLTLGAARYGDFNWRKVGPWRYRDALMRHLLAYMGGDQMDSDSSLPHLAHALCNVLFLLELEG